VVVLSPEEFVEMIPDVLIYIVPGFIVLKIIEVFTPKKKLSQMETILWSLFYSFIILLASAVVIWIYNKICLFANVRGIEIKQGDNVYIAISLGLSLIIGFIITKVSNSRIGEIITKAFNRNMSTGEDVWFKSLQTQKGAWATVYLKDGLIYTGIVSEYTAKPDDETKLLLLRQFRLMVRNETKRTLRKNTKFCTVIDDKTEDESARVLLRYDDIVAIELVD
jgi:hypothetical protein